MINLEHLIYAGQDMTLRVVIVSYCEVSNIYTVQLKFHLVQVLTIYNGRFNCETNLAFFLYLTCARV